MDSLINKIKSVMRRYNSHPHPWWKEEYIETIDLFYVLFLFSAVYLCMVTFFLPVENVLFVPPVTYSAIIMPFGFALAIAIYVIVYHEEMFK